MLQRGFEGTYHKMSPKHPFRYVAEFAGRHNLRPLDTDTQMSAMAAGMSGMRLTYQDLIGPLRIRGNRQCCEFASFSVLSEAFLVVSPSS